MRNCHALDALIEGLDELVHRAAALPRMHGNHANARKHVLDAVVKLSDQQASVLVSLLALRNVEGETFNAYAFPGRVELGRCCFLEPHFPAVWAHHAKLDRIRRLVGPDTFHMRFEARSVIRMDQLKKAGSGKGFLRVAPKKLCSVLAVMR